MEKKWKSEKILWSEFIDRLKTPVRSTETIEEYMKYPKAKQDNLKDVGGYVAGELKDGIRKNTNLVSREFVTLDLDNIEPGKTEEVLDRIANLKVSYAATSTRKHTEAKPRLRVAFLTDRSMTPEEYGPVARKIADIIGIKLCDPTTFEPVRLMYWPSCSQDSIYIYRYDKDSPAVSADGILKMYKDWRDMSEWPQVPGAEKSTERLLKKQENPLEKKGVIGAFCKTYNIVDAVEKFIPDVYEISDDGSRMTYTEGSTYGGVVIYDGIFAYSHHATDPISGRLCNAFDLVRIHKFGDLDNDAKDGTPVAKMPSFVEMSKFARGIKEVSSIINAETYYASDDFEVLDDDKKEKVDLSWMSRLVKNEDGINKKTISNMLLVLENDVFLKDKFAIDEFANRAMVTGELPWNKRKEIRQFEDLDDSGVRDYLEARFGLTGENKIYDAITLVSHKRRYNSVKEYLESLEWDGVKRVETLLVDYLGAEDNIYTREVMKVSLTAAVARAIDGSVKYDYMPIFTGPQGIGKSTFLAKLGKDWYSDSLQTFAGKEAAEMIQGTWINELGELTAFTKNETDLIKQFLSKTHDIYRRAYGRRTEKYERRCVFFGTSNDYEFLRDRTGNRRFLPVEVGLYPALKSIWLELEKEINQIWAEAYFYYMLGEPLDLSDEAKLAATEKQEEHRIKDSKEGEILEFLEKEIPEDWHTNWTHNKRRNFYSDMEKENVKLIKRDRVCAIEILVECFGMRREYIKNSDSMNINSILGTIKGWERIKTPLKFGEYGKQRGYKRIKEET
ncbi:MAG: virulence-associated E family protein [Bacteroidota bacterium]|nr:virulence-associated E family protein [Bacteroidota bacterium]